jgi:hypothetical protein
MQVLNDDLSVESEHKPVAQKEELREGDSLHTTTIMVVGLTTEGMVISDNTILKNKVDSAKFQKRCYNFEISKWQSI